MFVKPAEGMRILDPHTRRELPPGGANVPDTDYWNRLVRDGDVTVAAQAPTEEAE
jgi:hypothetical protein